MFRGLFCRAFGLLLFAAVVLCAAADAQASCGDYVHVGGSDVARSSDSLDKNQQPTDAPCHGPHCQGQKPAPMPPAPAGGVNGVDHWAYLTALVGYSACHTSSPLPDVSVLVPDAYLVRPLKPPRA